MRLALGVALPAVALGLGSAAQAQSMPTTIRFAAAPSDDLVAFWYAASTGMFKTAGLNVETTSVSSGAVVTQAVIGGAADIGRASPQALIATHIRGIPVVVVAPSAIHRQNGDRNAAIVVAPSSPIKSALDLQGKTVACTAIGDVGYLGLRALIDAQGGDSSTVKWIELPIPSVAAKMHRATMALTLDPAQVQPLIDVAARYKQILQRFDARDMFWSAPH